MTIYDKFAFRKRKCYLCERRFRFEPYNVVEGYLLSGQTICYKCANKTSEKLRKEQE